MQDLTVPDISWRSVRPDYRRPPEERLNGVMCLLFWVGGIGEVWLKELTGSAWFSGLEPAAEALAVAGGHFVP